MISKAKQKKILSVCEYIKMFKIPADTWFLDVKHIADKYCKRHWTSKPSECHTKKISKNIFSRKSLNREQCQRKMTTSSHLHYAKIISTFKPTYRWGGGGIKLKRQFKVLKTYLNISTPSFFFQCFETHKIKFQQIWCPLLFNFISYLLPEWN